MADEIKSDTAAASEAADLVVSGLGDYCSFSMHDLSGYAPVAGSATHDKVSSSIISSLEALTSLLTSDAQAIEATGDEFTNLDADLAQGLLGIGGGGN